MLGILVIEGITLIGRVCFKISVMKWFQKRKKRGRKLIRVHHFVWGLIVMAAAYLLEWGIIFDIGIAMVLSDLLHHLILKISTGDSEYKSPIEIY